MFTSSDVAPLDSDRFQKSLDRDLLNHQPGAVSIDPYYAYHGTASDPRNLHAEGALLASLSGRCADAGASLRIVNHYNQTGTGRGLHRITMAGAAEWCDSWWLLSHRDPPDVPGGRFRLLLEVGSRQWGGSEWDLDLNLGRVQHRHARLRQPDHVRDRVAPPGEHRRRCRQCRHPGACGYAVATHQTQLVTTVGGNTADVRASVARLERLERIRKVRLGRREHGRVIRRDLYAMFSEPVPEDPP